MALDSPLNDPKGSFAYILYYIDISLTAIFFIEALMKMLAYGIIFNGDQSYFRSFWNIMDFMILIISVSNFELII